MLQLRLLTCVLCLVVGAMSHNPRPYWTEAYTEAVPTQDFTTQNMSMAEEIFSKMDYDISSMMSACPCKKTGTYGSTTGTNFVDILHNPCSVDITDIWIGYGEILDSLKLKYKYPDGSVQEMPRRGAGGGRKAHITVPQGAKVIGMFGTTYNYQFYGSGITQLRILVLDSSQILSIYGPFGSPSFTTDDNFAVIGNIKSIFGYSGRFVNGIGVNYEPWGECGSPCRTRV